MSYKRNAAIAKKTIEQAKRDSWFNFIFSLTKMESLHKIIHTLKSKLVKSLSSNKVLDINNQSCFNTDSQMEAFIDPIENKLGNFEADIPIPFMFSHDEIKDSFTDKEFFKVLNSSKNSAPGADAITIKMVKNLRKNHQELILKGINNSWLTGRVNQNWKHSVIIPIIKPGKDALKVESYRRIALTSTISKLCEKMLLHRLQKLTTDINFFHDNQFGFIPSRSTTDCLNTLIHNILIRKTNKETIFVTSIDLHQAYDSIDLICLLEKIQLLPIPHNSINWLKNFLLNRTAQIKWRNKLSRRFSINKGLPTGTILSPFLFNLYIRDMFSVDIKNSELFVFADDIILLTSSKSNEIAIANHQKVLEEIENWCFKWKLKISAIKSHSINFSGTLAKNLIPDFKLSGETIPWSKEIKILGIMFNNKLTWKNHIQYITKRCQSFIRIFKWISSITKGAKSEDLLKLIRSHLISLFEYGCPLFQHNIKSSIRPWKTVLHSVLRMASGLPRATPIPVLMRETRFDRIEDRLQFVTLKYFLKKKAIDNATEFSRICNSINITKVPKSYRRVYPVWAMFHLAEFYEMAQIQILNINFFIPSSRFLDDKVQFWPYGLPFQDKNLSSNEIQAYFHQYKNECIKNHLLIAIDGSKSLTSTGYGIVIPEEKIIFKKRIPHLCSIFTCEGIALLTTIKKFCNKFKKYVILTDSRSNVLALENCTHKSPTVTKAIYQEIHNKLDIIQELKIIYVPAHQGIEANELADKSAKEGAEMISMDHPWITWEDSVVFLRKKFLEYSKKKWFETEYSFKLPYLNFTERNNNLKAYNRKLEVNIIKLRTKTAPLKEYLWKTKQCDSPMCDCGLEIESTEHFLMNCIRFANQRKILLSGVPVIFGVFTFDNIMKEILVNEKAFILIQMFLLESKRF